MFLLAEEVAAQQPRPDQVARAQELERAAHLPPVEIALCGHHVFEEGELVLGDEELQFARFAEIGLRREQRDARKPFIAVARHCSGGDGEQRAAQAVAGGVDLRAAADRGRRLDRRHRRAAIVVEPGVAQVRSGIAPGHAEDAVPLFDEVADQRIVRRKVENIVFHDPRRHDQHRLGMDRFGCGRVLDQLEQRVAPDHLARRHGEVAADAQRFAAAAGTAAQIGEQVAIARKQVLPALRRRPREDLRVRPGQVRRRDHVEPLPRGEVDDSPVLYRNAGEAGGGTLHPILRKQEALFEQVERSFLPARIGEAVVSRGRLHRLAARSDVEQPHPALESVGGEFGAARRRIGEMARPIGASLPQRKGRHAAGQPSLEPVQPAIGAGGGGRRSGRRLRRRCVDLGSSRVRSGDAGLFVHCATPRLCGTAGDTR